MKRLIHPCVFVLLLAQFSVARADSYHLGDFRLALIDDPIRVVFQSGSAELSKPEFERTIKIIGASKNWSMANPTDGRMELTNVIRDKHKVSVEVTYDATGYGIRYLQSANLLYAEQVRKGGTLRVIHRNYNRWIKELMSAVNAGVGAPAQTAIGFAPLEDTEAVPFLRENGRAGYKEFLAMRTPRAFAIAPNGAWGRAFRITSSSSAQNDVTEGAMDRCNQRGNGECKLYAIDDHVVWTKP